MPETVVVLTPEEKAKLTEVVLLLKTQAASAPDGAEAAATDILGWLTKLGPLITLILGMIPQAAPFAAIVTAIIKALEEILGQSQTP